MKTKDIKVLRCSKCKNIKHIVTQSEDFFVITCGECNELLYQLANKPN